MHINTKAQKIFPSINLEKDITNSAILDNIIVTQSLIDTTYQLYNSCNGNEMKSAAISIVGPFGSGKSTSALVGYHYLRGSLTKSIKNELKKSGIFPIRIPFTNEEIFVVTGKKDSLENHLRKKFQIDGDIDIAIKKKIDKGKRLVLIIDEFGKYLEYYADNSAKGDVYLLQQLAEIAQRSKGRFILLTIRHQAIRAYFSSLNTSYINEWKKIQGRFLDIVHTTNISETLKLLTTFLKHRFLCSKKGLSKPILNCLINNDYLTRRDIDKYLSNISPLHPFTALLMVSGFKRFGQNERSIYTFIDSNEKHSIKAFVDKNKKKLYLLSDFYDFLDSNMKFSILESDLSSDWNMIGNTINTLRINSNCLSKSEYEKSLSIIKSIGLIQMFGKDVGLVSSADIINAALINLSNKYQRSETMEILKKLNNKNVISFRKLLNTFILWDGSDLNINDLIENQIKELPKISDITIYLKKYFFINPIIAQKHLVKTGTMRWAEFYFSNKSELTVEATISSDSIIKCIIIKNYTQRKQVAQFIYENEKNIPKNVIPMVLMIGHKAEGDLKTLIAIGELLSNNEEIRRDKIARRDLKNLQLEYKNSLDNIFIDQQFYSSRLYIWGNKNLKQIKWTALNKELSRRFDNLFSKTPIIQNELINKEKPSPSATVGIKRLIKAIVGHSTEAGIGIQGTGPEKSIYINVIKKTGIHRKVEKRYVITKPDNDLNLAFLWDKWDRIIKNSYKEKINLTNLINYAKCPPFGIRNGLAKTLAIVKILEKINHISLYKTDIGVRGEIYIPEIKDDTIELLLRRPELFRIRYILTEKIHESLFKELFKVLENEEKDFVTLLESVKPLIRFVNELSHYTKTTQKIGETYHNVIQCIDKSVSPEDLIYCDIPKALKIQPISKVSTSDDIIIYIKRLKKWHSSVHKFEDRLIENIHSEFIIHWNIQPRHSRTRFDATAKYLKNQINDDVHGLIVDYQLKEFANRALARIDNKRKWFESVASSISGSRPQNWNDDDFSLYLERIINFKSRIDEVVELARKKFIWEIYSSAESEELKEKIISLLDKEKIDVEQKLVALLKVQEEIEKLIKETH